MFHHHHRYGVESAFTAASARGGGASEGRGVLAVDRQARVSELLGTFGAFLRYEWRFSPQSVDAYVRDMRSIVAVIGDRPPGEIRLEHVLAVKERGSQRGLSPARVRRLINALKCFLRFCVHGADIETMDPRQIRSPRLPRREVVFLTREEVARFVGAIPFSRKRRELDVGWLSFRALVEALLGSGMRISEALGLTRRAVNFESGEAHIVGKGGKERTVFFSPRALGWIKEYVTRRSDAGEALFAHRNGKPMTQRTVSRRFRDIRRRAGIEKSVTPHILRHTVATTLLFNGCPIGHIKEILGHEMLETTCKFYLGVDRKAAKDAHRTYLQYELQGPERSRGEDRSMARGAEITGPLSDCPRYANGVPYVEQRRQPGRKLQRMSLPETCQRLACSHGRESGEIWRYEAPNGGLAYSERSQNNPFLGSQRAEYGKYDGRALLAVDGDEEEKEDGYGDGYEEHEIE
jgi:integrase/recombinase XerD